MLKKRIKQVKLSSDSSISAAIIAQNYVVSKGQEYHFVNTGTAEITLTATLIDNFAGYSSFATSTTIKIKVGESVVIYSPDTAAIDTYSITSCSAGLNPAGGSGSIDTEAVQDIVGAMLQDSPDVDVTYDDVGNAETIALKTGPGSALDNKINKDMSNVVDEAFKSGVVGIGKYVDFSLDRTKTADCGFNYINAATGSAVASGFQIMYSLVTGSLPSTTTQIFRVGNNAVAINPAAVNLKPIGLDSSKEYGINFTSSDTISFPSRFTTSSVWFISIAQDYEDKRMLLGVTASVSGSWRHGLMYSTDARTFTECAFIGTQPDLMSSANSCIYAWYNATKLGEMWLAAQQNNTTGKTVIWVSTDGVNFSELWLGTTINSFSNSSLLFWDPVTEILIYNSNSKSLSSVSAMYKRNAGVWANMKTALSPVGAGNGFLLQAVAYNSEMNRYEAMFQTSQTTAGQAYVFEFDPDYVYNVAATNWVVTNTSLKITALVVNTSTTQFQNWHGLWARYVMNTFFYPVTSTNNHGMVKCPNDYFLGATIAGTTVGSTVYPGAGILNLSALQNVPTQFFITNRTKNGTTTKILISTHNTTMFMSFIFEPEVNKSYVIDNRASYLKIAPFLVFLPEVSSASDSIQIKALSVGTTSATNVTTFSYICSKSGTKINGTSLSSTYGGELSYKACQAVQQTSHSNVFVTFMGQKATVGSADSEFTTDIWFANNYN